ncbi:hypothetical protein [Myroides guanonis]|uniref:Uncharacterized protein n=1 Tax=Myroides guanonis TaxID=1150112 RepID=A0A1I3SMB3_9FLAO|nr:hypothetical protein [Myroides guanonis]SFJ58527.1 hypothetical protein SAMN04487893_110113 [Myroides guanonis]
MKKLDELQREIMQLMVLMAEKDKIKSMSKIESIRVDLYDALDFADNDDELVRIGKFLKIVEELEGKL